MTKGETMPKYKIADVVFETNHVYANTAKYCKDYLYNGNDLPEFRLTITQEDILKEKECETENFPLFAYECTALHRKLSERLFDLHGIILFHGSAIGVNEKGAYLFTGKSGSGKSTHSSLWRKYYGDKVFMINDDKPYLRQIDGKWFIYGTPWNGKHFLGDNVSVELKAVCKIIQSKTNRIEKMLSSDIVRTVMEQTLKPVEQCAMEKYLSLIDDLVLKTEWYNLYCDISEEAAKLSFETMVR